MRRRRAVRHIVVATLVAVGGACSDDVTQRPPETAGIANPASVYCVEQGGTVELVDEEGGVVGYCNLPDGTRIEEWELYRRQGS